MICNKCGTSNDIGNNFCSSCGADLSEQINTSQNVCPTCGNKIEKSDKFCSKCGTNLKRSTAEHYKHTKGNSKKHKSKKPIQRDVKQPKTLNFGQEIKKHKIILTAVVIVALFFVVKSFHSDNEGYRNNIQLPSQTNNISLTNNAKVEKQFTEVADKFICSCDKCEDPLTECDCDVAKNERNFIQDQLEKNKTVNTVTSEVIERYGHLKT